MNWCDICARLILICIRLLIKKSNNWSFKINYFFRVVEKLLKNGASTRKKDKNDYTPLHYASVSGHKLPIAMVSQQMHLWLFIHVIGRCHVFLCSKLLMIILESNVCDCRPWLYSLKSCIFDLQLLDVGSDNLINKGMSIGYTPLHFAVSLSLCFMKK